MKHTSDIFKSFLGSLLVVAVGYFNLKFFSSFFKSLNFVVEVNALGLLVLFIFLVFLLVYLLVNRRPLCIMNGRVGAMTSNVEILKLRPPKNRCKRYIYSTRVSFWPDSENENVRNEFRELLTQKINQGLHVKRIWQLHNLEDAEKLLSYLNLYRNKDNYSLKCFIGNSAFIPEILSVYGKVVSVSIPQLEDPRRLATAFHFRGKNEILRWESYFQILWERSLPIKHGNTIYEENMKKTLVKLKTILKYRPRKRKNHLVGVMC